MTKNFTIRGHVEATIVAAAPDFSWMQIEATDIGITTHAGRHHNVFAGTLNSDGTGTSQGTWTAANGQQLVWHATIAGSSLTVAIDNGTGRYLGASGGFTGEMTNVELDPTAGTLTYDYEGEGSVTY